MMNRKIFAIGFHGVCRGEEAPARSEAILESEDGYCASEAKDGTFEVHEPERFPRGRLPRATRFPNPIEAKPDHLVLVLGPEDCKTLTFRPDCYKNAQKIGDCFTVYDEREEINYIWSLLNSLIRHEALSLADHIENIETGKLEHAAWRYQRVAREGQHLEVYQLLKLSGSRFAEQVRRDFELKV